jgi:aspartyl-tRNA synthetase
MISPVENQDHAYAAFKTLSSPDLLLTLALGGDFLSLGVKSLEDALGNPVLQPHFAAIEAKRLGRKYGKRKPDVRASLRLISDRNVVVSHAELKRILEIARKNKSHGLVNKNQATVLIGRANDSGLEQSIVESIWELVAVRRSRKNEQGET